jgi:hypothetical protein
MVSMGHEKAMMRQRPSVAVVIFAVAVVAGVVGARLTGKLPPALVFAALVVVGMLLAYWLDRQSEVSDQVGYEDLNSTEAEFRVDLRGARVRSGMIILRKLTFGHDRDR